LTMTTTTVWILFTLCAFQLTLAQDGGDYVDPDDIEGATLPALPQDPRLRAAQAVTEAAAEVVSEEASDVASTPPGAPEPVTVKPKKIKRERRRQRKLDLSNPGPLPSLTVSVSQIPKPIVHHHINCSYQDHYCNPSAFDLITKVEDVDVKDAMECRQLCLDLEACRDFTYFNFRGIRTCFLLSGCNDKRPRCTVPTSCVSGRKDCADGHFCGKLNQKPGEDIAWRCQGGINPYKEDIPSETPCYTYCPSWRNKAGDVIAAKSICQDDGSWSEPRAFPPGELQMPTSLNKPDEEMMGCGCHALNLTYNPNTESGAEFYCDTEISDWSNLPVKIDTTNRCHLFCDKMLISITECKEGLWTGRPDLGFWCNSPRPGVSGWGSTEKLPIQLTNKKRKSEQQAKFMNGGI